MFVFAAVEQSSSIFALFENNLINWIGLVIVLGWLMAKFLPAAFNERESTITATLKEAQQARLDGQAFLKAQEGKIANAEREAEGIIVEAKNIAQKMKLEMEEQTRKDVADFSQKIEQEIVNERQLAITQLRTQAAKVAIKLTRANLPHHVSNTIDDKLLSQFIDQLKT